MTSFFFTGKFVAKELIGVCERMSPAEANEEFLRNDLRFMQQLKMKNG
jgi:hypothetical protein